MDHQETVKLLKWFAEGERIMEPDELAAAVARVRADQRGAAEESRRFWEAVVREKKGIKPPPPKKSSPLNVAVPAHLSGSVATNSDLEAFRKWRRGSYLTRPA